MKKTTSLILVFLLLLSTLGIRLVVNYCPVMEDYTISMAAHKSCCCSGEEDNSCCKSDVYSLTKIEDKYTSHNFQFNLPNSESFYPSIIPLNVLPNNVFLNEIISFKDIRPPEISVVSFTILYRTLLI